MEWCRGLIVDGSEPRGNCEKESEMIFDECVTLELLMTEMFVAEVIQCVTKYANCTIAVAFVS